MAIQLKYCDKKKDKMANVMLESLNVFFSDVPAFKVNVFASVFEFWTEENEY